MTFDTILDELEDLGVSAVIYSSELDEDNINNLASKLKKVHAKRFYKKVAVVMGEN